MKSSFLLWFFILINLRNRENRFGIGKHFLTAWGRKRNQLTRLFYSYKSKIFFEPKSKTYSGYPETGTLQNILKTFFIKLRSIHCSFSPEKKELKNLPQIFFQMFSERPGSRKGSKTSEICRLFSFSRKSRIRRFRIQKNSARRKWKIQFGAHVLAGRICHEHSWSHGIRMYHEVFSRLNRLINLLWNIISRKNPRNAV